MDEVQFYIVIAPAWLGSNHLMNILRSNKMFSNYKPGQLDFYNNNKFTFFHNSLDYNVPSVPELIPKFLEDSAKESKLAGKPCVLRIHLSQMLLIWKEIKKYKFRIVLIDYPSSKDSNTYRRFSKHVKIDDLLYSEQVLLYKPETMSKLFEIDLDDICDLSVDVFHGEDLSGLVYTLEQFCGVTFDLELIQNMHKIWLNQAFVGLE